MNFCKKGIPQSGQLPTPLLKSAIARRPESTSSTFAKLSYSGMHNFAPRNRSTHTTYATKPRCKDIANGCFMYALGHEGGAPLRGLLHAATRRRPESGMRKSHRGRLFGSATAGPLQQSAHRRNSARRRPAASHKIDVGTPRCSTEVLGPERATASENQCWHA